MEKSCTIQDVFERFYPSYEKRNSPPAHHRKTAYHIMNCKTGAFGVNISVCEDCGCISIHNNSCRSRCCPMCQEFPKEKWIDAQKENVLDAPYYHVVFTEALEYILHHSRIQTDDLQSCDVNNAWRRVSECLLFWHFHEKTE